MIEYACDKRTSKAIKTWPQSKFQNLDNMIFFTFFDFLWLS